MVVAGLDVNGTFHWHARLETQLQVTPNIVPAHAWHALPNGAFASVNERTADYPGLPNDHSLRFGSDTGADWHSHIPLLHPEDREFVEPQIQGMLATHRAFDFTKRIVRPDGEIRSMSCVGVPRTHGETLLGTLEEESM